MTTFSYQRQRHGFTLVELLVVIVIIGILAAILVPVAAIVIRRTNEAKILFEIKQISMATEQYKTDLGAFPLDMSDPRMLPAHVNVISRRNAYPPVGSGMIYNPANPSQKDTWYGGTLPNPHINDFPNSSATRTPQTMDRAEAMVFFLSELLMNADYPLGYRWDGSSWQYIDGEPRKFYDFNEAQLRDLDGDGWLEYVQAAGPEIPMMYFDSRTYILTDNNGNPVSIATYDGTVYREGRGFAQPYYSFFDPNQGYKFIEPEKYQIIAAGMDGDFGQAAYTFMGGEQAKYYNQPRNEFLISEGDEDNLTNLVEGRLDSQIE